MSNVVRPRAVLTGALVLVLGLTGTAYALDIGGTPRNDRIKGSRNADTIDAKAGNDLVVALAGDDVVRGGPGNDTIYAGVGRDETWGEDGNDTLWALARKDVSGPDDTVGDTLHGGSGDDRFKTRDGEADVIDCGPGADTALLDFKDVIIDATAQNPNGSCEVVNRRAPKPHEDRTEVRTPPEEG